MYNLLWWLYTCYVRPVVKWFLRRTTGLCELQRICYGTAGGAPRTRSVEYSLCATRSAQLRRLVQHLDAVSEEGRFAGANRAELTRGAVDAVLLVKRVNPRVHDRFAAHLGQCVEQIWGYRQLVAEVEALRRTAYDADDAEHERRLLELWRRLMPGRELEARVTRQWQQIGFQGDDPKTDFRGMGLLGLENLLAFARDHSEAAGYVLSHSHHPVYGYAFAIVGINLTNLALTLLRQGDAKTYFFNATRGSPDIKLFHQFYSYLFYAFDKYWIESKPRDIMEFSNIRDSFESNVRSALQDPDTMFRINLTVDTI